MKLSNLSLDEQWQRVSAEYERVTTPDERMLWKILLAACVHFQHLIDYALERKAKR